MQVQRIQNNYNNNFNKSVDFSRKQNLSNISDISFQGGQQQLTAISADAFKTESAKKLYAKIQRYFQLIGKVGNIKDVKLFHEKTQHHSPRYPFIIDTESDVFLSINRGSKNSRMKLSRKYTDNKKPDEAILDVTLDKNGQMVNGYLTERSLFFERSNRNLRRIHSDFEKTYLPVGGNDREWNYLGDRISLDQVSDYSNQGAFEIFLELARLQMALV